MRGSLLQCSYVFFGSIHHMRWPEARCRLARAMFGGSMRALSYFVIPWNVPFAFVSGVLALQLCAPARLAAQTSAGPTPLDSRGDIGGLVDIGGGRRIYLECHGTGGPTVVLEAGYRSSARVWSEDSHQSGASRTMVLAGVAAYTRVCAYDRPGTVAHLKDGMRPSRSDPIPQPRTASDVVSDLHALLHKAGVPGPFVLLGHSWGGFFVRLFAST